MSIYINIYIYIYVCQPHMYMYVYIYTFIDLCLSNYLRVHTTPDHKGGNEGGRRHHTTSKEA